MKREVLFRFILFLSVCTLFGAGGGIFAASAVNAAEMGEACAECHEIAPFEKTFHGRAWTGMDQQYTCQSCHGSTDQHVNDPSKQTIVSFSDDGGRTPEELNEKCLGCHASSTMLTFWPAGMHSRNDITCVSCHDIHTARSDVDQLTVCFTCHRSVRGEINKRSRHPIEEGKVKCSDCHNPHGTQATHSMIKAPNVNQLCYTCHPDKRGPYVFEHPPVAENCSICHTPHGSRHNKLMAEKIPNLCQDCHDWSRHPGTPYDAETGFTGSSPSNRFFARSCLNCHGAIHGSTHFEHHGLTR